MTVLIQYFFGFLAVAFDEIPGLNRLKGYRSAIGLLLLAILNILTVAKVSPEGVEEVLQPLLLTFTGLALNAKTVVKP